MHRARLDHPARRRAAGELRAWPALHAGSLRRPGMQWPSSGLPYPLAILAAIVALAVLGALMQGAMMGLVMTQNLTSLMIVTLGLGYVLQGGSALIFGGNPQTLPGTLSRAKVDLGIALVHLAGRSGAGRDAVAVRRGVAVYPEDAVRLGHSRGRGGSEARRTVRHQCQGRLSPRLRVRMLGGCAWRGAGGAALTDPDQHGLQRGHHDLRGRRARRHRLDWRRADRGAWSRPVHRVLRRVRGAGLHDGGGICGTAGAARGPAGGIGGKMTVIESHASSLAPSLASGCRCRAGRCRLLPAAAAGRHVRRLLDADDDRDLRGDVLRRRYRAVLSRRSQPRTYPVLGDRRLHRRQSVGEIRPEWLEHGGRDDRALHRRSRIPRRRNPADAGVRVFAGDLCRGGRGLRDRVQLGCYRRLRRHRRHFRAEAAVRLCDLCRCARRKSCGRLRSRCCCSRLPSSRASAAPGSAPPR